MAVVITVSGAATPGPSVLLTMTGLNASAATLTVERVWANTTEFLRDANTTYPSGGGAVIRDYEAPLGRDMTYRVVTYSTAGAVLDSVLSVTFKFVTAYDEPSTMWVMDALDPARAIRVIMLKGTETATFEAALGLSYPITGNLPTALLGARNRRSYPLIMHIGSRADAEALELMISLGGVLSIRPAADSILHPTGILRVAAASVRRTMFQAWSGRARYVSEGVEVAPDAWPEAVPWATWDDWVAARPSVTWVAYGTANPGATWLDVMSGARGY